MATTLPRHSKPPTRWAWIGGLIRLAWFLVFHPHVQLPTGALNVKIPAGPRGVRLLILEDFAGTYGTTAEERFGVLVAERRFGPLVVEAHLADDNYTSQIVTRAMNGNGAVA